MKCEKCGKLEFDDSIIKKWYNEYFPSMGTFCAFDGKNFKDYIKKQTISTNNSGGNISYVEARIVHNARKKIVRKYLFDYVNENYFSHTKEYKRVKAFYDSILGITKLNVPELTSLAILCYKCQENELQPETYFDTLWLDNLRIIIFNDMWS